MMALLRVFILLMVFTLGNAEGGREGLFIPCRGGWSDFRNRCYKYFPDQVKWITAERNCQKLGGHLASSLSKPVNDYLLGLVPTSTRCWIGANDAVEDGEWLWSDGSSGDYNNWCSGEPNNYGGPENCLEINFTSKRCWNDQSCSTKLGYICSRDL